MRKFFKSIMLIGVMGSLSGCIVTDNSDENKYERMQFQSLEDLSEIVVTDISADYKVEISDRKETLIEYSDSSVDAWYDIYVSDGILKIDKTRGTVGVKNNTVIISLPEKDYKSIAIETTNGDIVFDNIKSEIYKCSTENGNIKGTLKGNGTDYHIVTKTQNGNSNLNDNIIESSRTIEFNTKNGDVNISFSE